ncbi:hypothetical protein SeGA_2480, partial [Salmonella enterica subsp. enterica serovar Gaminara str. A4-567]
MQIKEITQFIIHGSYVVRILVSGEAIFSKRLISSARLPACIFSMTIFIASA